MSDNNDAVKAAERRRLEVAARIEKSFNDPQYSNLAIVCENRTWHVHRVTVCRACPFFEKASMGGFMEAKSNKIHLKDDPPNAVHAMLRYLYTGDYEETDGGVDGPRALVFNLLVHTIADKYDIPSLCELAKEKFTMRAANEWDQDSFAEAIEELYTGPDASKEKMKKAVAEVAAKSATMLFGKGHDAFHKVTETAPKFTADMARELARSRPQQGFSRYTCPNLHCGKAVAMETTGSEPWDRSRHCHYCGLSYGADAWKKRLIQDG